MTVVKSLTMDTATGENYALSQLFIRAANMPNLSMRKFQGR